ncbi:FtsX-like permease family protein [Cellulomonas sp.]|uniref:FtsX-like permease family protein n=1 Tax=Cellulomonas sp. TaxID=40001 RepID=UPI003BAA8595
MGWSLRVLRHRAAAQRTLLATVVAVALVGASLLGTFALLLFTSENRALDTALNRAPATATDVDAILTLGRTDPLHAVASGGAFLDDLLGDVPSTRTQWLTSPMYRLPGLGVPTAPMAYLAVSPQVPAHATLLAGAWPVGGADGEGRVQVAVPKVAADRYGWAVGTELPVQNLGSYTESTVVVVGIHELAGPRGLWTRDLLLGAEHDPSYPVPGSFGFVTTDAWGPFVVAPEALSTPESVATVRLVASPRLADSPPGAVDAVRGRLDDAQATLVSATEHDVSSAQLSSRLATTIDAAQGNLAVTRVSLVIVGLMLVVLAVTVLLLAARLLADRRAPEQTLMSSRGASGRQLLGLAALEAGAVALVTTLVSPWLAGLLFQAITSVGPLARAGLHHDPGRPASLWITCIVSSFVLAAVLLGPLLRRRGSVVDAEQQLVRQDRRGGLARSGADLALVVLAGLAVWQLRAYRSPVVAAGPARLDPVLVAAPALLLLAGAVLTLRLLPLVARAGEQLAARSRSLVAPLAAWEVGRRPGRAAGAVLLLTLALAVGSFSQSFLSTWRTSQAEQVDLATGTDVRLDRMDGSGIAQAAVVGSLPGVQADSPVTFRSVDLGEPSDSPGESRGRSVNLLALDTTQADALLRGRISPSWATLAEPLQPTTPVDGVALPGSPSSLVVDVESSVSPAVGGLLLVSLVVEDPLGTRTPLELPPVPLVGISGDVEVALPATSPGLRLVGVVVQTLPDSTDPGDLFGPGQADVQLDVRLGDLRAVERPAGATTDTVTPVALAAAPWTVQGALQENNKRPLLGLRTEGEVLRVTGGIDPIELLFGRSGFAATTFAAPGPVPVVVTDTLMAWFSLAVGDELELDLGGVRVPVVVQREVAYLPGLPTGAGVLADRDLLTRAALLGSSTDPLLDEWWLQVPDASAPALVEQVRQGDLGVAVDRVTARAVATEGPLRVGVQAALWIVTVAAVALAVAGFAMSATVAVRTRRLELARLQALGAARSGLVRSVLVEHGILGVLGLVAGLTLGAVLGQVVAPLVTVSAAGARPVPAVLVQWPWPTQAALAVVLVVLVGGAVALTTNTLLRRASGELLRLGDER